MLHDLLVDVVSMPETERYGAKFIPEGMTIQDWGVTWDEIEPYYDRFERACWSAAFAR